MEDGRVKEKRLESVVEGCWREIGNRCRGEPIDFWAGRCACQVSPNRNATTPGQARHARSGARNRERDINSHFSSLTNSVHAPSLSSVSFCPNRSQPGAQIIIIRAHFISRDTTHTCTVHVKASWYRRVEKTPFFPPFNSNPSEPNPSLSP